MRGGEFQNIVAQQQQIVPAECIVIFFINDFSYIIFGFHVSQNLCIRIIRWSLVPSITEQKKTNLNELIFHIMIMAQKLKYL